MVKTDKSMVTSRLTPYSHSKRNKVIHWPDSDKIIVLTILESLLHEGKHLTQKE